MRRQTHLAWLILLLLLCGCKQPLQLFEKPKLGPMQVQPLWSMPIGCEGGFRLEGNKLVLTERAFPGEYYQWTLDVADGHVLTRSEKPVSRVSRPDDTLVEVSAGRLTPLRPSAIQPNTPSGFEPIIVTDKFLLAKKTRLVFRFPRIIHFGQVLVIDRVTREAVWAIEGRDVTAQATANNVFVCDSDQIATFGVTAGRPPEITEFYTAIHNGDVEKVRRLFPVWQRASLFDVGGSDPVTVAAKEGNLVLVRLLLKLGLSPNTGCADGYSPLLMALNWEHPEVASALLESGADPNYDARFWEFPLTKAVHAGRRQIIELLLRKGAKINAVESWSGRTALHEAVMYLNYEAVETLIEAGANVHAKDKDGKTPAQLADFDTCVAHLFSGGKVSEKPQACAPPKRETSTFDPINIIH
jgi:hypothetical protein